MSNIDISEAVAALDRLSSIGKALYDARAVVDVLQNAEQVERETGAAIEALKAELVITSGELDAARRELEATRLKANDATAKAARDARALMDAAKARVNECEKEIADKRAEADEQLADAQVFLNEQAKAAALAATELAELEDKIAATKKRWVNMQNVMEGTE